MAFLFMPNGVRPDYWTPAGDGEDYEITPHLKPLAPFKSDFLLLENLWNRNSIGRNGHWPKVPIWLSGGYVQRTTADDLDTGAVSVDQFAAQRIGALTPLPSIELGIDAPRNAFLHRRFQSLSVRPSGRFTSCRLFIRSLLNASMAKGVIAVRNLSSKV